MDNNGRLDSGRQQRADGIAGRDHLSDGEVDIDVRLKEYLDYGDSLKCLGLHVADIINVGADGILTIGRDALIHFLRRQPGLLPYHRDDRDIDVWKYVLGRCHDCAHAEE